MPVIWLRTIAPTFGRCTIVQRLFLFLSVQIQRLIRPCSYSSKAGVCGQHHNLRGPSLAAASNSTLCARQTPCHGLIDELQLRLYSERQILARGLAHPIVFMGRTTPRALDGVVDGVVKQSEEQSNINGDSNGNIEAGSKESSQEATRSGKTGKGEKEGKEEKEENGMQTFFTKVSKAQLRVECSERRAANLV